MKLTQKQRRFCETYASCGNGTRAAEAAGYGAPTQAAARLLTNVNVRQYVLNLTAAEDNKQIAASKQRQEFWTTIMRDESVAIRDRLKASELLGKAQGDFLIRAEIQDVTPPPPVVIQLGGHTLDPVALGWTKPSN